MPVWTPAKIVDALKSWAVEHGRAPRAIDFRRANLYTPSATTVSYVFGSWRKGLAAAGLRCQRDGVKTWTRRAVVDALTEWYFVRGAWPTGKDWARATAANPNRSQVYEHFGSWAEALAAAGKPHSAQVAA